MVDQVIHHEGAKYRGARHRENFLPALEEGPGFQQMLVAGSGDCLSSIRYTLVKAIERFLPRCDRIESEGRSAGRLNVELLLIDRRYRPGRQIAQVRDQVSKRGGLVVRLPLELVFGYSLQTLACVRHLIIEFREQCFSYRHPDLRS